MLDETRFNKESKQTPNTPLPPHGRCRNRAILQYLPTCRLQSTPRCDMNSVLRPVCTDESISLYVSVLGAGLHTCAWLGIIFMYVCETFFIVLLTTGFKGLRRGNQDHGQERQRAYALVRQS